jgi:DNA (cytosine-5)-methyltransferase 1
VITAIDSFAGGGGSTEGLVQAGIQVVWAANHWETAVGTHQDNHPDIEHHIANLLDHDWRAVPRTDVGWFSPSCRGHAPAGGRKRPPAEIERLRADAAALDRATAFAVISAAEVLQFPVVIVENVPEFASWSLYRGWLGMLHTLGYRTRELLLDAVDFGLAQRRRRLFVVATLDGVELDLTPPAVSPVAAAAILDPNPGKPLTRRLYISDQIDTITDEGVPHLVTYRNHARALRADAHPLATVTAGGNHHAVAQLVDGVPHQRLLSNRECARAQGFPDTYRFRGAHGDVKKQIGNAVPVSIARWLGERAIAALSGQAALAVAS